MELFTRFEHKGQTVSAYYDCHHETEGSYAYDTKEETLAAEQEERSKLESGEWVVLLASVSHACPTCNHHVISDSLSGIVIENDEDIVREYLKDVLSFEEELYDS
jgi:hypothetical protein